MALNELKRKAEAAMTNAMDGPDDWYDADTVEQFLCGEGTELAAPFIAAASPATVLKLLEMIRHYRAGLENLEPHLEAWQREYLAGLYARVDEIERSL